MEQTDAGEGKWIAAALERYLDKDRWEHWVGTVAATVPDHFEAYARILHRVNGNRPPELRWADVAAAKDTPIHPQVQFHAMAGVGLHGSVVLDGVDQGPPVAGELDEVQLAALAAVLAVHTATPDYVYQAVWVGWGGFEPGSTVDVGHSRGGTLNVAHGFREYFVFRGTNDDLARPPWFDDGLGLNTQSANPAWPVDRTWCLATEVDFDSTLVGGSAELIAAVVHSPDLEALEVTRETKLTSDADTPNG